MVLAAKCSSTLDSHHVFGLFNDADLGSIATFVPADGTDLLLRDVEADLAELDLFLDQLDGRGQPCHVFGIGIKNVKSNALSRLWADARQATELVDQFLYSTFVHVRLLSFLL